MSLPNAYIRLLLRGSLLLTGMLALWWVALRPPMLFLLRVSEEIILGLLTGSGSTNAISVDTSGDWNFRIPVEDTHQESGKLVKVSSLEFTIPRDDVVLFTFSWPVFWALMFAAPGARSHIRAVLWGTGLVAVVEALLLLGLIEITVQAAVSKWHPPPSGLGAWWREFGDYLITSVMPFFAPVAIAIAFHRELRLLLFPWNNMKDDDIRARSRARNLERRDRSRRTAK